MRLLGSLPRCSPRHARDAVVLCNQCPVCHAELMPGGGAACSGRALPRTNSGCRKVLSAAPYHTAYYYSRVFLFRCKSRADSSRAIAKASSALVVAASHAQREQVAAGLATDTAGDDSEWSNSLVSASKIVAAATSSLCEAANAAVQVTNSSNRISSVSPDLTIHLQGGGTAEKLIASAKAVANSTAQLLVACKVAVLACLMPGARGPEQRDHQAACGLGPCGQASRR